MPDLHITSTLLSAPTGALSTESATGGAGAFSSLLAGTIAAAPAGGAVLSDAAEPGLSAIHALYTASQSTVEPAPDPALDPLLRPGRDAASTDSDPQAVPDSATQLLMALGVLPPPVAPREGTAAGPREGSAAGPRQGVAADPRQAPATAAGAFGTPADISVGASGSALVPPPAPATGPAGDGRFDPADLADTAHELPRPDTFVPVSVAAGGMQKGARTGVAVEAATGNGAQAMQAPHSAAAFVQHPIDSGAAPAGPSVPVQLRLAQPVGSPAWREAFSSSVSLLATQRVTSANLNLHPAELGPVQVSIRIEGGEASIVFSAQHADTRNALDAALPRLREMLEANGIALGEASVGQQSSGSDPADRHPDARSPAPAGMETALDGFVPPAVARAMRSDQLVDTFA